MKKYIIKYADGRDCRKFNSYKSRNEASDALLTYLYGHNEHLSVNDDAYSSLFDFKIVEIECKEENEVITDFKSAKEALAADFYLSADKSNLAISLMNDINPKHIDALVALNKLFTIAQAWNKEDGFVPDFSDWEQNKWFPWFKYDEDAAGFVCAYTLIAPTAAYAHFGSRLCFNTSERAAQFGKQFADLYNKVFL